MYIPVSFSNTTEAKIKKTLTIIKPKLVFMKLTPLFHSQIQLINTTKHPCFILELKKQ